MRRCRALLFPRNEDFGIVPVEAQACGAPVIAYLDGGATETISDATAANRGTGWFFEEQTTEALVETMTRFESGSRRFCPELARAQSERFSIDRYKTEMLDFLGAVSGSSEAIATAAGDSISQGRPPS